MLSRSFHIVIVFCPFALRCAAVQLRQNNASATTSYNPIMMFAHGCSMTTAGINVVGSLLNAHGITTANIGNNELMKSLDRYTNKEELKNRMGDFGRHDELIDEVLGIDSEHLGKKFEVVYNWANSQGATLFWKMEEPTARGHADVAETLRRVDTKAFLFFRTNLIDVLHCRVVDFCDKTENLELGILVDKDGYEATCGFRGRATAKAGTNASTSGGQTMVKLNVNTVLERLERAEGGDKIHQEYLEKNGFDHQVHSAEDLFAFEYVDGKDAPEFQKSAQAWMRLLESVDITPDQNKVEEALLGFGKFSAPKKHSEDFYNFEEIKEALKGTKYYDMLRM